MMVQSIPFPKGVAAGGGGGPVAHVGSTTADIVWNTSSNATVSLTGLTGGTASAPAADDLVIIAYAEQGSTPTLQVATAGYTKVTQLRSVNGGAHNFAVFYKFMGATPDTSVDLARQNFATGAEAIIQVYSGVDQTNPMDVTPTTATGTDSEHPNPPAITPVTTGAVIVAAGGAITQAVSGTSMTSSDLSNFVSDWRSSVFDVMAGMGSASWTSGSFDPAQWSAVANTGGAWCACTMALRPA